ncbi:MAG: hypothetical protein IT304_00360 [Dehalococcoidia bacterium]|nr:hypothetical protein [Dehalococcoidia bacterium]
MSDSWDGYCSLCATRDHGGEVRFGPLVAAADEDGLALTLCWPCYSFAVAALDVAARREVAVEAWPGLPERLAPPGAGGCDLCGQAASENATSVSATPSNPAGGRPTAAHYRSCPACLSWFQELLNDESLARMGRRGHAGEGQPPPGGRLQGFGVGLTFEDDEVVRQALAAMGHTYSTSSAREAPYAAGDPHALLFVAAGPTADAAAVLDAIPRADRGRTVVVARQGQAFAAMEALRRGGGDLLAAPLSRWQVAGTLHRLEDREAVAGRDPVTGLPVYRALARFGFPCQVLAVRPGPGVPSVDVFLSLRRFLRGYDRIGMNVDGTIPVHLYCEDAGVQRVVQRLGMLLGCSCAITVRERVAPLPTPSGGWPAPLRPGPRGWPEGTARSA